MVLLLVCMQLTRDLFAIAKFLLRVSAAMLMHVLDIPILSVCLSVTRWYCIKTAEHIVMLSSLRDSAFILVLCVYKIFAKFRRGHPLRAAKEVGYKNVASFDQ